MAEEPLIRVRDLRRTYRVGRSEVEALRGVDVDLGRGEFLAVVGVSGSGKSTLLHLLGGLDTPTAGTVEVDGRDLGSLSSYERAVYRRRSVGFVFQSFHLLGRLSAAANVSLALTFQGTYGAEQRRLVAEALDRVGLGDRVAHRPGQLSGGEQQRVALARAVVHRPQLLLLDEPTGNLDRATAREMLALVGDVRRELGATVVLVTHDDAAARATADRVVRLRDGRLIEGGERS